jgi:NAD(P)H-hydrate epimerase
MFAKMKETFPDVVDVPAVTTAQMRAVDRLMIEDYGVTLVQMMENAGLNLARLARSRFLAGDPCSKSVVVLAGRGGNGGGALVCARRLHTWGADVHVVLARPSDAFEGVPAHQLRILQRMAVSLETAVPASTADVALIVDGLVGYSLSGAPRGRAADLIRWANAHSAPILALDVPSGVDATTGRVFEPAIRAAATLTLALPKTGLRPPEAAAHVGELYLADIGVPPDLYAHPDVDLAVGPLFARSEILRGR